MRRHHGILGNIADAVSRHKELKHSQRLNDDLSRGDFVSANYHASKASRWGDINYQLNAPRGPVVYPGVVPVHHAFVTQTVLEPMPMPMPLVEKTFTTSTIVERSPRFVSNNRASGFNAYSRSACMDTLSPAMPMNYPMSAQSRQGYHRESHNVTSQSNGGYYHSESNEVSSPTGYHAEKHKVVDKKAAFAGLQVPVQSQVFNGQAYHKEVVSNKIVSPPVPMFTSQAYQTEAARSQLVNSPVQPFDSQVYQSEIATSQLLSPPVPANTPTAHSQMYQEQVTRQVSQSPVMPTRTARYSREVRQTETSERSASSVSPYVAGSRQKSFMDDTPRQDVQQIVTTPFTPTMDSSYSQVKHSEKREQVTNSANLFVEGGYLPSKKMKKDSYFEQTSNFNNFDGFGATKVTHREEKQKEYHGRY